MASINLSGVLRDPLGEVSYGNKIRFTHNTTTGETVKGFRSVETVVINGEYDIDLEYGNVHIESYDKLSGYWVSHGVITINSDTPASSIPALLGITTPATDEDLLVFQALVADAELARDEAQTAQSETEALFDSFDSSVADAISTTNTDVAFEATFNDSLNISKGYGTHDTITVASETVDLPSKSVDFACASERTVINKSGVLETVSANEPAIESGGLWCHEAYSNEFKYSEEFTNTAWSTESTTVELSTVVGPDGSAPSYKVTTTADAGFSSLRYISTTSLAGETWTAQIAVKKDNKSTFRMIANNVVGGTGVGIFDLDQKTAESFSNLLNATIESIGNGWFLCSISFTKETDAGQIKILDQSTTSVTSGDSFYIAYASNTQTSSNVPYVKTESTAVSVAKTSASIPAMNNLPAAGEPFAIEVDCAIPYTSDESVVFRQKRTTDRGLFLKRTDSGDIQFSINMSGLNVWASYEGDSLFHKYVCKYDGSSLSIYEDGSRKDRLTNAGVPIYRLDEALNIGSDPSFSLNSQIKNFRIHHGLVSDDTIKSWGAAV